MTFLISRYAPPINNANADTSPIVPEINPRNALVRFVLPSEESCTRGVAPDTPSTEKSLISDVKEINRKHLAPRAGFMKFCPIPPKNCFTKIIAKTLPNTGIHSGISGGIFMPIKSPVTSALPSVTVTF